METGRWVSWWATERLFEVPSAYSGPATFAGASGTLQLDQSTTFAGTVAGMTTTQDTLNLMDINFATVHTPTFTGTSTGGILSVTDGVNAANIALLGNYMASTFVTSSDGHGGTRWSIRPPSAAWRRSSPRRTPEGFRRETKGISRHVAPHGDTMRLCFYICHNAIDWLYICQHALDPRPSSHTAAERCDKNEALTFPRDALACSGLFFTARVIGAD